MRLLALAFAAGVAADYIHTNFYLSSTKCNGVVFQQVAQLVGCSAQGSSSLTVSCLNDTAAMADVFSTTDCTGPSRSIEVPFDSACSANGAMTSQTQCVTGEYSELALCMHPGACPRLATAARPPPPSPFMRTRTRTHAHLSFPPPAPTRLNVAYFPGPPNSCPTQPGVRPEHYQDITYNVCLQSSPTSWIKLGCNAVNVTQSYWTAKGCVGTPAAIASAIPLGCSETPADPAKPNPSAGPRVTVCGKKQQGEEGGAAALEALPLPMEEARAAVVAALAQAAAAAVARAAAL